MPVSRQRYNGTTLEWEYEIGKKGEPGEDGARGIGVVGFYIIVNGSGDYELWTDLTSGSDQYAGLLPPGPAGPPARAIYTTDATTTTRPVGTADHGRVVLSTSSVGSLPIVCAASATVGTQVKIRQEGSSPVVLSHETNSARLVHYLGSTFRKTAGPGSAVLLEVIGLVSGVADWRIDGPVTE